MTELFMFLLVGTVASHGLDATCIDGDCSDVVLLQTGLVKPGLVQPRLSSMLQDSGTEAQSKSKPATVEEADPGSGFSDAGSGYSDAGSETNDTGSGSSDKTPVPAPATKVAPVTYGNPACQCIGVEMRGTSTLSFGGAAAKYPTKTGTSCQAWDENRHPDCKAENPPSWCHDSWCYVDPCTCALDVPPKKTLTEVKWQGKPAYWSYATCGETDTFSATNEKACVNQKDKKGCSSLDDCAWDGKQCVGKDIVDTCKKDDVPEAEYGKKTCRCVGFFPKLGDATLRIDEKDMHYPASVGGKCDTWDKDVFDECKADDPPSWCTQKWCYVDPCECELPSSQPKKTMTGAKYKGKPVYWSYGTCGGKDTFSKDLTNLPAFPPSFCPSSKRVEEYYGDDACKCIGVTLNGTSKLKMGGAAVEYPTSTGTSCHAWDDGRYPDCQSDHAPDWCEKQWCYVDPCNCNIAVPPKKTITEVEWQGKPAYWSYATCGADDTFSASNKKACPNKKDKKGCSSLDDCAWDGKQCLGKDIVDACKKDDLSEDVYGVKSCRCVGFWPKKGDAEMDMGSFKVSYPASVGGKCEAWDMAVYPGCEGKNPDDFCSQKWCYVDPCSCKLDGTQPKRTVTGATYQGKPVYWSYNTCGGEDKFTEDLKHLPTYPPDFCPAEEVPTKSASSSPKSICLGLALVVLAMLRHQ